jgi:hypothetical protein
VQERQLTIGWYEQQSVGFGLLTGHLREEFGAGDADGDGQPGAAISTGVPDTRRSPETSRKASSTESGSTIGVVS